MARRMRVSSNFEPRQSGDAARVGGAAEQGVREYAGGARHRWSTGTVLRNRHQFVVRGLDVTLESVERSGVPSKDVSALEAVHQH